MCARVACPTLRLRALLGEAEPILTAGGRVVGHCNEIFQGIDVSKSPAFSHFRMRRTILCRRPDFRRTGSTSHG
jgi:hypothetical protein